MFSSIKLIRNARIPLYLQLTTGLSKLIQDGSIPPETKLPPIRLLAKELKINRDTVVSAYKALEQRGLVYGQTGRGTYVSPSPSINSTTLSLEHEDSFINLSTLLIPSEYYPIEKIEYLSSKILSSEGWDAFCDKDGTKYQHFQNGVCKYFKSSGIRCTPKQIMITHTVYTLFQQLSHLTPKAGICIENPSKDMSFLTKLGFKLFNIPIDNEGMNLDILEQLLQTQSIQYIYVTTYLQNPTGICYSTERKLQLIEITKKYNVIIIEEDTYSDLLLDSSLRNPLYSNFSSSNVIYIKHFSKLYVPTLSYTFIALPISLTHIKPNTYEYTFTDALFHQYLESCLPVNYSHCIIQRYQHSYLQLLEHIDLYLSPYLTYSSSFGGLYIWLCLNHPTISVQTLCNKLLSYNIIISPGILFYDSPHAEIPYIRLSIANISTVELELCLQTIATILKSP